MITKGLSQILTDIGGLGRGKRNSRAPYEVTNPVTPSSDL